MKFSLSKDWYLPAADGKTIDGLVNRVKGLVLTTRPDPTKDVCKIPIKIADLGNACWTVGTFEYNFSALYIYSRNSLQ